MAGPSDTKRALAGLAWFACNSLTVATVIASVWFYFDRETLKAIYWLLLAVPISRLADVFVLNDPEGDAEYAAFLKSQANLKQ
jgi:hypothetical protein